MNNSFVVDSSKQLKAAHKTAILAWNEEGGSELTSHRWMFGMGQDDH